MLKVEEGEAREESGCQMLKSSLPMCISVPSVVLWWCQKDPRYIFLTVPFHWAWNSSHSLSLKRALRWAADKTVLKEAIDCVCVCIYIYIYIYIYISCLVVKLCLTLWDPRDCSLPGSSVHGISQEVGCHFLLQGIFPTQISNAYLLLDRQILYQWTTWEALYVYVCVCVCLSTYLSNAVHHGISVCGKFPKFQVLWGVFTPSKRGTAMSQSYCQRPPELLQQIAVMAWILYPSL